ncbi:hypothetical protein I0C86_08515 [Plantactinospora sp. S1510]|uniref:Uncharacterized protein n=1 Tax=Plantactinospora alkalitolerans TaxID=2789879 RepID=A0ABS0GT08_9ACTN|nr:hypothetical protein [Plantactinospora alkalitolerans]MBF9129027.1 hypothetical protein [Plantactinospora alkalitolerans]
MHDEYLSPSDILDVARRVVRVHGDRTCINCTPDGCLVAEWAAVTLFEDAVAAAPTVPRSWAPGSTGEDRKHLNRTIGRAPG